MVFTYSFRQLSGVPRIEFTLAATHIGLLLHSNTLLLVSFSYRLWVTRRDALPSASDAVIRSRLLMIALLSTVPALLFGVSELTAH